MVLQTVICKLPQTVHMKEGINALTEQDLCHHSSKSATDAGYQPVLDEKGLCFEMIFCCDKIVTKVIEKHLNRQNRWH